MAMAYMLQDIVSDTGDENVYVALCIALGAHASCNVMTKKKLETKFQYLEKNMAPESHNDCVRIKMHHHCEIAQAFYTTG